MTLPFVVTTHFRLKINDLSLYSKRDHTTGVESYYLAHDLPCVTEYQEITPELYDALLLLNTPVSTDAPQFIKDYCEARGHNA
jgi:hypothetical protein